MTKLHDLITRKSPKKTLRAVLYGPEGVGKAQPLDAQVLTPYGFVNMGDIRVGDTVIGANGRPCRVTGVFPQGVMPVYRVSMTDGVSTECSIDHLWPTKTVEETPRGETWKPRSLSEILESFYARKKDKYPNHRVPVVAAVDFAVQQDPLPLHPYLLGLLLGDGLLSSNSISLHKPERDVLDRAASLVARGDEGVFCEDSRNGGEFLRIKKADDRSSAPSSTKAILSELGLVGSDSITKFIPKTYLFSDIESRTALLRGLCDTDGHVIHTGCRVEFTTSSQQLSEDVLFLIRSLGGTITFGSRIPSYYYKGEKRFGARSYRIVMHFPNGLCPVSSEKQLSKWRWEEKSYQSYRSIASVEPAGEKECQCIKVDAEDQLYVTDDFIVTHNTSWAANSPNSVFLFAEEGSGQLEVSSFPRIVAFSQVLDYLRFMLTEEHGYQSVIIDTIDALEPMIWDAVCKENGAKSIDKVGRGFGEGYKEAMSKWRSMLELLERLESQKQMHCILLAHSQIKTFNNPEGPNYDRYMLKINDKAAALIREWSDDVLFANYEIVVDKEKDKDKKGKALGGARRLFTTHNPAYDAKNRHGLPETIPLSWDSFANAASITNIDKRLSGLRMEIETSLEKIGDEKLSKAIMEKMPVADLARLTDWKNKLVIRLEEEQKKQQEAASRGLAS